MDKSVKMVSNTTPWAFIIQVILLIIHYGHFATLPWWLVWLPILVSMAVVLIGIVIGAFVVAFSFSNKKTLGTVLASGVAVAVAYLCWLIWGLVTRFLMSVT